MGDDQKRLLEFSRDNIFNFGVKS